MIYLMVQIIPRIILAIDFRAMVDFYKQKINCQQTAKFVVDLQFFLQFSLKINRNTKIILTTVIILTATKECVSDSLWPRGEIHAT